MQFTPEMVLDYYEVIFPSPLYDSIQNYHIKCRYFKSYAEYLKKRYQADSVFINYELNGIAIRGLNFLDENAPLKWDRDRRGFFYPVSQEEKEKFSLLLPYFSLPNIKQSLSLRYCFIDNKIILAIRSNRNGAPPRKIEHTEHITAEEIQKMALKHAEKLNKFSRYFWSPLHEYETDVFTPSKAVQELNKERYNAEENILLSIKHCWTGLLVRRALMRISPYFKRRKNNLLNYTK